MEIVKMVEDKMGQNSYLVVKEDNAILIDGGISVSVIEENLKVYTPKPKIRGVFVTHCHFDHIRELDSIIDKYKCCVYIAKEGKKMLYDANKNLSVMERTFVIKHKKEVKTFVDLEVVHVEGGIDVKCCLTPGHSVDSSCFVIDNNMFTGDTVFKVGVGRTDLYSGDDNMLKITLERVVNELSVGIDNFYPGHGSNFDNDELCYNIQREGGDV